MCSDSVVSLVLTRPHGKYLTYALQHGKEGSLRVIAGDARGLSDQQLWRVLKSHSAFLEVGAGRDFQLGDADVALRHFHPKPAGPAGLRHIAETAGNPEPGDYGARAPCALSKSGTSSQHRRSSAIAHPQSPSAARLPRGHLGGGEVQKAGFFRQSILPLRRESETPADANSAGFGPSDIRCCPFPRFLHVAASEAIRGYTRPFRVRSRGHVRIAAVA